MESLKESAFYTLTNNTEYAVYVYHNGKKFPARPNDGEMIASVKGVQEYAGYHTVSFPESFTLREGEYFSVVLKLSGGYVPAEMKCKGYSENAEVNRDESYFSADGVSWSDGVNIGGNACVKAFTILRR